MAFASLQSRMFGFGAKSESDSLAGTLKLATEATSIVVPEEAMLAIIQASQNDADRRVIMQHLATCLAETTGAKWRRVFLAIATLEELLKQGPTELVTEISNGLHFDLNHRTSLLENFEYSIDMRVQNLVRSKATSIREGYQQKLKQIEELPSSTRKQRPAKNRFDLLSKAHNDNTTDESSDEDIKTNSRSVTRPKQAKSVGTSSQEESTVDGESTASSDKSPRSSSDAAEVSPRQPEKAVHLVTDLLSMTAQDNTQPVQQTVSVVAPATAHSFAADLLSLEESPQVADQAPSIEQQDVSDLLSTRWRSQSFDMQNHEQASVTESGLALATPQQDVSDLLSFDEDTMRSLQAPIDPFGDAPNSNTTAIVATPNVQETNLLDF